MTLYAFLEMSYINIERKDIHKILVILRLFTNLLRTNLNKKCKNLYVIRIVTDKKNNETTQKKDKNAIK